VSISLNEVTKSFGDDLVLDRISDVVPQGSMTALSDRRVPESRRCFALSPASRHSTADTSSSAGET
jgi:hypothetical protein